MKKASLILIAIFMVISLCSCNEGNRAVKDDAALTGDFLGENSGAISEENSGDVSEANSSDISEANSDIVTDGSVNVALGKSCTFAGIYVDPSNGKELYADSKETKLTDGVIGKKEDITYASPVWVGLNIGGKGVEKGKCKSSVTVDLGKTEEKLNKFVLFAEQCDGGVGQPKWVDVLVSTDNSKFASVGSLNIETLLKVDNEQTESQAIPKNYGIYSYTVSSPVGFRARYVKFVITHTQNWVFVSEAQVFQNPNAVPAAESDYKIIEESKQSESEPNSGDQNISAGSEHVFIVETLCKAFPNASCLEDMYKLIYDYSSCKVGKVDQRSCVMYKGNGFNTLVVFDGSGWTMALVEDYRDKTFTFYNLALNSIFSYADFFLDGSFDVCNYNEGTPNYDKYRRKLNSSATSEKTLKRFDFISTENAFIDFADFYNGKTLDKDKVFKYVYAPERVIKDMKSGYVTDVKVQSNVGYDIYDRTLFKELLQIAYDQNPKECSASETPKQATNKSGVNNAADYIISCSTFIQKDSTYERYFEFMVGVSTDGKKFIKYMNRYSYINDTDYNRICEICNKLWHNYVDVYGKVDF